MAAFSSSTPSRWLYDVFLSFRGEDTRKNFVDHLYEALVARNIRTFKDDENLERGNSIAPELFKAIEGSRFAIVIFSQNYASSSWCLDELVKITECKKRRGLTVLPVFYHVEPSDVRKQTGSFAKALEYHDRIKVSSWRQALTEAANTSGWDVENVANGHESKVIHELVMKVFNKLDHPVSNVKEYLVGIDSRVDELKSLLELGANDVRFIGIWGMGGIGKTTVASALFDNINHQFESAIFIHEVRERSKKYGLENLQEIAISKILSQKDVKVQSISHGMQWISGTVCHKKALVILDDVDSMAQVNALAGNHDWFGQGSRIIITTRDRKILANTNVAKIHLLGLLGLTESVELFNLNAFKKIHHPKEFEELSGLIVEYAGGLPLALKVLGTFLYGRDIEMWKSAVDRLRDIPEDDIIEKLRVSFDHGLKPVEQEIFLDIACFFKGEQVNYAKQVLDSFGFYTGIGIPVLVEKSLLVISEGELQMHDLLQEMGWHIVRQVHPRQPGKYNRLWDPQEVCDVLTQNTGTEAVEGLQLDFPEPTEVDFSSDALKKMDRLRLLKFCNVYLSQSVEYLPNQLRWLHWDEYPSKSLPATFKAANLVGLDLHLSHLEQFWPEGKKGNKLKFIDLRHSQELTGTPDFNDIPNLQRLVLEHCKSLEKVHQSIAFHKNLVLLNLKKCINLQSLPDKIQLVSLEKLILSDCIRLDKFPDIQGDMNSLSELYLDGTGIEELPLSIKHLNNLVLLQLSRCRSLRSLPSSICGLRSLRSLRLSGCELLLKFPDIQGDMDSLSELYLDGTSIEGLPLCIERLKNLVFIDLSRCRSLKSLSNNICSLQSLRSLRLSGCELLLNFPDIQGNMDSLFELYLDGTGIEELPLCIERLKNLVFIDLSRCRSFKSLPNSICNFRSLRFLNLSGCSKLFELPGNLGNLGCLEELHADNTAVIQLPASIGLLKKLKILSFTGCKNSIIPQWWRSPFVLPSLSGLSSLVKLYLSHQNLTALPSDISCLSSLLVLDISGNNFISLPSSMTQIPQLQILWVVGCKKLQVLPELPSTISELYADDCELLQGLVHPLSRYTRLLTVSLINCSKLINSLADQLWHYLLKSASMLELENK
ncbi:hypothetical protein RJ640_002668 [Escallonia rubra]|uniref:TIR domain-containing protein n=1 Tax=Escallonia rubra TaxID=112253 RepID=A0AA88RPH0_9ASTE|nr:hypothetical protein RJ640_002668 [Escallonia rubra]